MIRPILSHIYDLVMGIACFDGLGQSVKRQDLRHLKDFLEFITAIGLLNSLLIARAAFWLLLNVRSTFRSDG